jgi:outer membrane protein assembly factor BamB
LRSGFSNIAIQKNRLYAVSRTSVLCLKAKSGKEIWQYPFESNSESLSTPTVDDKHIYILRKKGMLLCLKTKNGELCWETNLVGDLGSPSAVFGYAASPVVEGDLIILNAKTSGIALHKETGEFIWEGAIHTDRFGDYFATPVIYNYDDARYALLFSNSGLFSMDVKTGRKLWFFNWEKTGSPNVADPVLFDNKVFISSSESNTRGAVLDIGGDEPRVAWENENMANHISTCVYIDGYLYGVAGDYHKEIKNCFLRCIDAATGDMMWEKGMSGASLIAADEKLIILEVNGALHIAKATSEAYTEISSCILPTETFHRWWTPPVLSKGRLYCRNYHGDLVCIDVCK